MTAAGTDEVHAAVEAAYLDDGATLAWLTRRCGGDLGLAEDALQDALAAAIVAWEHDGIPRVPRAWLRTTARRRAIDRLRRSATGRRKHELADILERAEEEADMSTVTDIAGDDQLTMIFTCCHPALRTEAQVALALRSVCGLSTPEIAQAFLVGEATMAQRLTRAKGKIVTAAIPFRTPPPSEMPDRLASVLGVIYLVFTEGHAATGGDELVRTDLCDEAIRMARLLHKLMPDEAEVGGLLALLLFQHSRRSTRIDGDGRLVRLEDQDRSRWDHGQIAEAAALLTGALRRGAPKPYVLQAAIAAGHATTATAGDTDWGRIRRLYDELLAQTGSPVVALNRAVAVAEDEGPAAALVLLDDLAAESATVDRWHHFHGTRAEMLRRTGDHSSAAEAYQEAISRAGHRVERDHLTRRLASLR